MRDSAEGDGRLGVANLILAVGVGAVVTASMFIWGVRGLDPVMWDEVSVVAGVRPPLMVFPGLWRGMVGWLFPWLGLNGAIDVLCKTGWVGCGLSAALFYLILRQILALLIRSEWHYPVWSNFIAPFFAVVSAVAFGLSDPLWRISQTFGPELIRLLLFLASVLLTLRWFTAGGRRRIFPAMLLTGILAGETPLAFVLPVLIVAAYASVWHCVMDGLFPWPEKLPEPENLPKWRMLSLFFGGLLLAFWANGRAFMAYGGLEANGMSSGEVWMRYVVGYWRALAGSASWLGWLLGACFAVLPFLVGLRVAPLIIRDDRPMVFPLGLLMSCVGVLAVMQSGAFVSTRFWTFSDDAFFFSSGFLLAVFVFCGMCALAFVGAAFAFECQRTYLEPDQKKPGFALKMLFPVLAAMMLAFVFVRKPKPVEQEIQRIVEAGVEETVKECGDATRIFTDGHLDAGLELAAARAGKKLLTMNMMSGGDKWGLYLRTRGLDPESQDWKAAETGASVLLRQWFQDSPEKLDDCAVQLGFELWKRERRQLPPRSGFLARTKGLDEAEAKRGIDAATALGKRILAVAPLVDQSAITPALRSAFSAVNWRISRLASLREDHELAKELDDSNQILKQMLQVMESERTRVFMQMTPREGLHIALSRADFSNAQRYAAPVLDRDEEDPEANFAMGMSAAQNKKFAEAAKYLKTCLKRRPNDPAVLNNLSIVCRKLGAFDEALVFARKAAKLLPNSPEVKRALQEAEKNARH